MITQGSCSRPHPPSPACHGFPGYLRKTLPTPWPSPLPDIRKAAAIIGGRGPACGCNTAPSLPFPPTGPPRTSRPSTPPPTTAGLNRDLPGRVL